MNELKGIGLSDAAIMGRAETLTAPIDKITAENTNAVIAGQSWSGAVKAIDDALEQANKTLIQIRDKEIIFVNENRPDLKKNYLINGNKGVDLSRPSTYR